MFQPALSLLRRAGRDDVEASNPKRQGIHLANLVVVVMDNQEYATTGGQPTPTAHGADLEGAARAMGIAAAATVRGEAELRGVIGRPDQVFIVAKVKESAPTAKPPLDCVFIKQRFMSAIRSPQSAIEGAGL